MKSKSKNDQDIRNIEITIVFLYSCKGIVLFSFFLNLHHESFPSLFIIKRGKTPRTADRRDTYSIKVCDNVTATKRPVKTKLCVD